MKLRTIGMTALAIALLTGIVYAGGKQEAGGLTIEKGTLLVGMEIGYPPMEYYGEDGKTPIGFDVDMANAIAAKMGLKAKFIDTAWDGIFDGVNTGKYDCIMSSVTISPERLAAHNFSKPYIANNLAIVLLKGSSVRINSPSDLAGLGVAYQAETTSDFYLADYGKANNINFTTYEYDKVMNCFDELKLGRVDAIITDKLVAVDYVAGADSPFEIVWEGSDLGEFFGICMKKGNDALTAEIDKALDALFADGTMLKISNTIFGMDMVSATRK
jgi:polar amino acid transport system substrate-binding protein